jgi:hypothetical protein
MSEWQRLSALITERDYSGEAGIATVARARDERLELPCLPQQAVPCPS